MRTFCRYASKELKDGMDVYFKNIKKEKTKNDYISVLNEIMIDCEKDFFSIKEPDAVSFLHHLEERAMKEQIKWSTLNNKLAKLHAIANFFAMHPLLAPEDYQNPFFNPHQTNPLLEKNHVLSLLEIDTCLKEASASEELFLAIALAFRMGLTSSMIVSLKTEHFFMDKAEFAGVKIRGHIKKVPADILNLIDLHIKKTHIDGYLLQKENGKPFSERELQVLFKSYISLPFTLQDIRNTSIAYMKKGGASSGEIADYMNITMPWLYRYDKIVDSLTFAAVDYHYIKVCPD